MAYGAQSSELSRDNIWRFANHYVRSREIPRGHEYYRALMLWHRRKRRVDILARDQRNIR
jgi:hypothetical protein